VAIRHRPFHAEDAMTASAISIVLTLGLGVVGQATDAKITEAERAELISLLQQAEQNILREIDGLSDAQWTFKPGPERWSVGEVLEHIVLADALLFETAVKSLDAQPDPNWEATLSKTDTLKKALPNRSRRVDAPAAIKPQKALSRADLVARFKEQRSKALAYARSTDKPLKSFTSPNPFFGSLNAHQWLLYIPLHEQRHTLQIIEVKASAAYPK
jgi:hypothetical protein